MSKILQQLNNGFNGPKMFCWATLWRVAVCIFMLALPMNSAASQTGTTSQHVSKPVVVELSVIARDDLPSRKTDDPAPTTGYPGWIENNKLLLHPEAARQIRWQQPGRSIFFSGEIKALKDVRYVFVERVSYDGTGRSGTFTRFFLSRTFPSFPKFVSPGKVFIGPLADRGRLMRTIPWPPAQWRMPASNILEITTRAGVKQLEPGKEFEIAERSVEIPMWFVRYKTVPIGNGSQPVQRQESAVGTGRFSAKVTIVFHGALAIEVAK